MTWRDADILGGSETLREDDDRTASARAWENRAPVRDAGIPCEGETLREGEGRDVSKRSSSNRAPLHASTACAPLHARTTYAPPRTSTSRAPIRNPQPDPVKYADSELLEYASAGNGEPSVLQLREKLGEGATSIVFSGRDPRSTTDEMAVKMLLPTLAGTVAHERFLRESELLCRLSHPNLVRGLGHGMHAAASGTETPFLVMERLPNGSLRQAMRQGKLGAQESLQTIKAMADVLGYLMLDGRVQAHRDIKPSNILFASDGTPKLADLGVAKTLMMVDDPLRTNLAGTVRYMAPEQMADCRRADIRSDIYSLGIVLGELLGCHLPGKGDEVSELASRFARNTPTLDEQAARLLGLSGQLTHGINTVLATMCAYEPHQRYQTPQALSASLSELLQQLDGHVSSSHTQYPAVVASRRMLPAASRGVHRHRAVIGVAGAVATAVALALALQTGAESNTLAPSMRRAPPTGPDIVVQQGQVQANSYSTPSPEKLGM